jgi:hypothetical protein
MNIWCVLTTSFGDGVIYGGCDNVLSFWGFHTSLRAMIFEYGTRTVEWWLAGAIKKHRGDSAPVPLRASRMWHEITRGWSVSVAWAVTPYIMLIYPRVIKTVVLCCLPCRMCQVRNHCGGFTSLLCLLTNLKLLCSLYRSLRHVDVGSIADISEVTSVTIWRVQVVTAVSKYIYIYIYEIGATEREYRAPRYSPRL